MTKKITKKDLLKKTVKHIDITSFDARPIIDQMADMSFTSRDLAKASEIFNMMLKDKKCSIILSLAGSTSAGGCMKLYADLVKNNMVDAIVAQNELRTVAEQGGFQVGIEIHNRTGDGIGLIVKIS